jgi:hypothetical protein
MTSNMPKKTWPFRVAQISRPKSGDVNADAAPDATGSPSTVRAAGELEPHRELVGKTPAHPVPRTS